MDVLTRSDHRGFRGSDTSRRSHSVMQKVSYSLKQELGELSAPILDLLGHGQESLFYISSVLGRGLEEGNVQLISEFLWDPT